MQYFKTTGRWWGIALIFSITAVVFGSTEAALNTALLGLTIGVWLTSILHLLPDASPLLKPLSLLRRIPSVFGFVWLIVFALLCMGWLIVFQPAAGILIQPESIWYGLASAYVLFFGLTRGMSASERAAMGERTSWGVGLVVTIGSLLFILLSVELGLRYVWVMSDNFAFSKMHQNWSRLYWNPLNELGYRDVPVAHSDQNNVLILGDSLTAGYGVNDIADTFPHLLDAQLPDEYVVNIVAQPGWGISTALGALEQYPLEPDVLILSHFINDILEGPAGQAYRNPFPQIRIEPEGTTAWWVDNFHSANFLYYRAFHYFTVDSATLYNDHVQNAYSDTAVWAAYESEMQAYIDYAQARTIPLIVLVWPNLLNVEGSQAITQPVIDYFEDNGIAVIDMALHLQGEAPSNLIVNPFDAHPSHLSHQRAADALYESLIN